METFHPPRDINETKENNADNEIENPSDQWLHEKLDNLIPLIQERWPSLAKQTIEASKGKIEDLVSIISNIDKNLISNVKVFDLYEGDNIPENQKSIAISVTIQSLEKTLTDNDLEKINNLIIETVENKTGAKIRS